MEKSSRGVPISLAILGVFAVVIAIFFFTQSASSAKAAGAFLGAAGLFFIIFALIMLKRY